MTHENILFKCQCDNKVSMEHSHALSSVALSTAAFILQKAELNSYNTEDMSAEKPQILTIWAFTEKLANT